MLTRLLPALLAVLTTLVLGAGTTTAAAPVPASWSVTPGGPFTGHGGPVGPPTGCGSSDIAGTFATGGAPLGVINQMTYRNCTTSGLFTVQIDPGSPWTMFGNSHVNGVTSMTITNIVARVSGPGCRFAVNGSAGTAYDNATGVLTVKYQEILVTAVDGCFGLVSPGQRVALLSRSYAINPRHTMAPTA